MRTVYFFHSFSDRPCKFSYNGNNQIPYSHPSFILFSFLLIPTPNSVSTNKHTFYCQLSSGHRIHNNVCCWTFEPGTVWLWIRFVLIISTNFRGFCWSLILLYNFILFIYSYVLFLLMTIHLKYLEQFGAQWQLSDQREWQIFGKYCGFESFKPINTSNRLSATIWTIFGK